MCGNLADLGVKAPRHPCVGASCEFPLFSQVDGYTPQITCQAHGALTSPLLCRVNLLHRADAIAN